MYRGELFNSITHLVGTVMAVLGSVVLITSAVRNGAGARQLAALSIYGAMMVVLYLSSTLYHSLRGKAKKVFHVSTTARSISSSPGRTRRSRW